MAKLDVMRTIENAKGKVNKNYTIFASQIDEIRNKSTGEFEMICNAFLFGYARGMRAERMKQRISRGGGKID